MRHWNRLLAGALFAVPATVAAEGNYNAIEEQIRTLAPNAKTIAVSETPIEGLLMVEVLGDIVYATEDGKYLIQGRVIDMETREDLTESAKAGIRKELLAGIDPAEQITFAPEQTAYDLLVFTDIDCGYCRKLHAQMDEYNAHGIAIHYLSFPRAGVGSRSYEKAVSVWCSQDPQTAMTRAKQGAEPEPQQCDNPVAQQYQLGMELGVTGTPALLTSSGRLIPGYVPPEQLRERLDMIAATSAQQ